MSAILCSSHVFFELFGAEFPFPAANVVPLFAQLINQFTTRL
jgi:hypothetical protein